MSAVPGHLEALNNAQRKAAGYGEPVPDGPLRAGPLLVIAGAGTGKTNTLAHRVAHLVLNNVDPQRIMLLTFTRRAALEMRRRALEILRKSLDDTLGGKSQTIAQRLTWTGTFHSLGNRLLRHYAPQAVLTLYTGDVDAVTERVAAAARGACAAGSRVGILAPEEDLRALAPRIAAAAATGRLMSERYGSRRDAGENGRQGAQASPQRGRMPSRSFSRFSASCCRNRL